MYALVKLIEVGFPKCIINYKLRKSDESRFYFPEWYYSNKLKSDYYMSDEDMYSTLINDYADIISITSFKETMKKYYSGLFEPAIAMRIIYKEKLDEERKINKYLLNIVLNI